MLLQASESPNQLIEKESTKSTPEDFSIKDKLQEKFRDCDITDPKQQRTITDFFDYITKETSNKYSNELIKYIDNMNPDDFDEILSFDEEERKEESLIIIGQLDDNSKQTSIDTYNAIDSKANAIDSKANAIDSKANAIDSTTEQKQDQKTQIDSTAEQKQDQKTQIDSTANEIELKKIKDQQILKALNEARESFSNLPDSVKTDKKFEEQNTEEQEAIRKKVAKINQANPEKAITESEFFVMQQTSQNLQGNPQYQDFVASFQKLNMLAGESRSITRPKEMSGNTEIAIQTTNHITESNPSLNNFCNNINGSTQKYQQKESKILDLNDKEVDQEIHKPENQKLFKKYKNLLKPKPKDDPKQTEEQNLKNKVDRQRDTLLTINKLEEQTHSTIQKRVLGSVISGVGSFFDFSTGPQENLGEDFEFSIEKGFQIDQANNIFYLGGKIQENQINIAYNLGSGNLSIEDYLFQSQDHNVLNFGKSKFQDLKIKLPPISLLTENALEISNKDVSENNSQEYIKNLESNLHESLQSNFKGNSAIVRARLKKNVQKNLAAMESLNNFQKIINPKNPNIYGKSFNKQEKSDLFGLVKTLDDSLENYNISESRDFRNTISIHPIIETRLIASFFTILMSFPSCQLERESNL